MDLKSKKVIIDFEPISRRVFITSDKTVYDLLSDLSIRIRSICNGSGTCGKCRVLIQKGNEFFNLPTKTEKEHLDQIELDKAWRLACQVRLDLKKLDLMDKGDEYQFRIFLPNELMLEDFNILTTGVSKGVDLLSTIKKYYLEVDKPNLEEPQPDYERIVSKLISLETHLTKMSQVSIDFEILNDLPNILRENNHKITVALWQKSLIISCEPGNTVKENYGIAFDIGTTTIVGYLINLNNGKICAVDSKLNSQTAFGEDIITRITAIKEESDNLYKLNAIVINDLNDIILDTCRQANISPAQIYEATIVGNTVMHHIFLGINPINIGLSPFIPVIQKSLNVKASKLNLNISKNGNVFTAPIIAGFVGADTIGVILASNVDQEKELTLVIDIGTNGEIIIGNRKVLAVGSCAAGSALEGAHISDGMRAAAGAIDSINIDPKNLEVSYSTIRNKKPIGICGSGLVDAIAEMLKSKIITRSGSFNKTITTHERFIKIDKFPEFIIAKREETSLNKDITITQDDIRQLQMAKAAFYSGAKLILNKLGANLKIQQIFLAGAFGSYINVKNAKFIGMIPDIQDEKIHQIGNAAGMGAQHCLLNKELRNKAQELLNRILYVEIAIEEGFQKEYVEAMYFPHYRIDYFPSLKEYKEIPKR